VTILRTQHAVSRANLKADGHGSQDLATDMNVDNEENAGRGLGDEAQSQ